MQWTDSIRRVKIMLVVSAVVIAAASLVVSHFLIKDLQREEKNKMEVWAEAMRSLDTADENTDLGLVLKVIDSNNTIPVIVLNAEGEVETFRNLSLRSATSSDSTAMAREKAMSWRQGGQVVRINLSEDSPSSYIDVCYDDSLMLRRLAYYPYIQLGVVMIFVVIAVFALLTSKRAEQNKVWVGLSKETAHQLGTPISSMMAWTEMLKESYPDDELLPEMEKDVRRLQLIADRFSKIGSLPEARETSLTEVLNHVIDYMERRTSSRVTLVKDFPDDDIKVMLCSQLFEWVIETLCKNAVDALEGNGRITLLMRQEGQKVVVEVSDNGKGIRRKDIGNVFRPGFTTKKRGWGLGLSLAKRIIEEYHKGRIFVKESEVGVGTTFRIELTA